jgi:hypothetical protein
MEAEIPYRAWERIDQFLLNGKLAEIAEDRQRRLVEERASVRAEGRERGNAGFYPMARVQTEERIADEWASAEYQTALDVWTTQGYGPCVAVPRAIYGHVLELESEQSGVQHVAAQLVRAMKIGRPGTGLHTVVSATSTA